MGQPGGYDSVYVIAKAGMEGVDKEFVRRVVHEMSKVRKTVSVQGKFDKHLPQDSAHYKEELRKQQKQDERVSRLQSRMAELSDTDLLSATR
jgi:hypothetical protein